MRIKIDMEKFINFIQNSGTQENKEEEKLTNGERYLLHHILPKWMKGGDLTVGEIDYDAFDSEDVLSIIKNDKYDIYHSKLSSFVNAIEASKPVCDSARKFF